jgi:hypothetical protein
MSATAFVIKHSTNGLTFARELPEPQESKNHPRTAETTASTRTLPHEVSPPNDHEWDWQNTQTKSAKEAIVETPSQSKNRWTDVWWSVHGDSKEQKRIETVTRRWCLEIESNEGARRREGCIKTNRALPVTVSMVESDDDESRHHHPWPTIIRPSQRGVIDGSRTLQIRRWSDVQWWIQISRVQWKYRFF